MGGAMGSYMETENFQHIIRVANTNVDGRVVPQPQPRLQDGQDPAAVLLHAGQQAPRGPGAHEEDPAAPRSAPLLGPQGPRAAHLLHRPERWPPQPHHRAQVGGGAGDWSQGGTLLLLIERVRPGDGGGGAGRAAGRPHPGPRIEEYLISVEFARGSPNAGPRWLYTRWLFYIPAAVRPGGDEPPSAVRRPPNQCA